MKKVTLKDIANELGVTIATVSHALNDMSDISKETKEKVLQTAEHLGYISNTSAISLRSGKTNTIAIIVPDISNPHIAHQIKLIDDYLLSLNYSAIILNTDEDDKKERNAIITACSKQVDGILLCPAQHNTKNIEFLKRVEIPFVLIGRYFAQFDTDYVCADDYKGGYIAGNYLLEHNLTNPLYIGTYHYIEASDRRFQGLKDAFTEKGQQVSDISYLELSPKSQNPEEILQLIEQNHLVFDSVVAFSDLIAFEITPYIQKTYDHSIPIIGFDAIGSHFSMPFCNVSIGMRDNGWADKAANILIKKIQGETDIHHELIDVDLYEFHKE